jgi:hypothetical protein
MTDSVPAAIYTNPISRSHNSRSLNYEKLEETVIICFLFIPFLCCTCIFSQEIKISDETQTCLDCHTGLHPGIVEEWGKSRHALTSPSAALKKQGVDKLVSSEKIPETLLNNTVGCAECHTINPETHKDSFDHADFSVHPVVTPKDCSVCHSTEAMQYEKNIMSHAYGNLMKTRIQRPGKLHKRDSDL